MFSPPDYSASENFLNPRFGPWTVFLYLHRKPILEAVKEAAPRLGGRLLDVGCGNKPYASVLRCREHIGVDVETSSHSRTKMDNIYDGAVLPFGDAEFDSVLCTEVLEHCRDPQRIAREMWRVLKPGGYALLTAPMVLHHHEEPWDFQRFTRYGMKELADHSGFQIAWIRARGNMYSAGLGIFYTMMSYTLSRRPIIDVALWFFWPLALLVRICDHRIKNVSPSLSLGWQMLVQKPNIATAA